MKTGVLQEERASYQPKLPRALQGAVKIKEGAPIESIDDRDEIKKLLPRTYGMPLVESVPGDECEHKLMNVDVILSGGQAPGEHNVTSGLFDTAKKLNEGNHLYGFLMGPGDLVDHNYIEIIAGFSEKCRNTGGFDMIGPGRTKLEKEDQFERGLEVIRGLDTKALVIIGSDDSNASACVLAEYCVAKQYGVQVIGCLKTISGDLKNEQIGTSFGFDAIIKAYSELIRNIEHDCNSTRKYWHFIKLMGHSTSHIALGCALQTQPSICFMSEEIQTKDKTLSEVVKNTASVIAYHAKEKNNLDMVLIPEGLIEFIPAIGHLIAELNDLLAAHGVDYKDLDKDAQREYILVHFFDTNRSILETLPEDVARQLNLDYDPHGDVRVSLIETEKLLSNMVSAKLNEWKRQGKYRGKFLPLHHFFGREGRCATPSNLDANYYYAFGTSTVQLIANGKTGYMTIVKDTTDCIDSWRTDGVPIIMMMNMERRTGEMEPVIRETLVELEGRPFKTFAANRDEWANHTCYVYPGSIQYWGPSEVCNQTTRTLALEQG